MSKKSLTPFSHVNLIYKLDSEFDGNEGYSQYVINKELSKNGELIDVTNLIQQYKLNNEHHFKVMNSLFPYTKRPGFNKFPWIWKGSTKVEKIIEIIAQHYNESIEHSKEYYQILKMTKKGKEHIKWLENIYGLNN